jgi:hypothetical protein
MLEVVISTLLLLEKDALAIMGVVCKLHEALHTIVIGIRDKVT